MGIRRWGTIHTYEYTYDDNVYLLSSIVSADYRCFIQVASAAAHRGYGHQHLHLPRPLGGYTSIWWSLHRRFSYRILPHRRVSVTATSLQDPMYGYELSCTFGLFIFRQVSLENLTRWFSGVQRLLFCDVFFWKLTWYCNNTEAFLNSYK